MMLARFTLSSTIRQHYAAPNCALRDAAIRTIAETLRELDRGPGHSNAPASERLAQRRERDHGDDYGL